jgi:hypothetical protein
VSDKQQQQQQQQQASAAANIISISIVQAAAGVTPNKWRQQQQQQPNTCPAAHMHWHSRCAYACYTSVQPTQTNRIHMPIFALLIAACIRTTWT